MATIANFRDRITLGRTGLAVSRLGIGAGYGISDAGCRKAFHEYGINYFYWSLPRRGGMQTALKELCGSYREELVVVVQSYDHFGFFLEKFFHRQLRKLGIDYADVLLLGWFNRMPPDRVIETARRLREEGKTRYVALSGHHRPLFAQIAQDPTSLVDILMIRYNAAHRGAEHDVFPYLPETNRPGVCTYTTTCWGKLLKAKNMPPGEAPMSATDCYRFALTNPNVDMCLIGPKDMHELEVALNTLDRGPMSEAEVERCRRIGDFVHG